MNFARPFGGRLNHLLVPGTKVTQCGLDASLMARWAPADARADVCVRPTCPKCRAATVDAGGAVTDNLRHQRIKLADLAAGNPGGRIRPAIRPIKPTAGPVDSVTESGTERE